MEMTYSMVHISEFAWKHNHENSQKNPSQRSRIESRNSEIRNRIANYYTVVVLTHEVLFQPKHESYSRSATIHKQVFLPVQTGLLHRLNEYLLLNCATFTNLSCRQSVVYWNGCNWSHGSRIQFTIAERTLCCHTTKRMLIIVTLFCLY